MRKLSLIIPALVMLILQSCATTQSLPDDVRTKIYNADYDQVFKTVVQTLSDGGYIIQDTDSEMGIINTDYTNNSNWEAFWSGDERTKVNALLKSVNNGTRVRLTISVQNKTALSGWNSANMSESKAKEYYQKMFEKIGEQLSNPN